MSQFSGNLGSPKLAILKAKVREETKILGTRVQEEVKSMVSVYQPPSPVTCTIVITMQYFNFSVKKIGHNVPLSILLRIPLSMSGKSNFLIRHIFSQSALRRQANEEAALESISSACYNWNTLSSNDKIKRALDQNQRFCSTSGWLP